MERDLYLNSRTFPDFILSVSDVKTKILEFSEFLNNVGRPSLSHYDKSKCEEIVSLLLSLNMNIKYTLSELGCGLHETNHEYICCECKEPIYINPYQNFWTCLQNHEHVEYLYSKFLNGSLDNVTENMEDEQPEDNNLYSNPVPSTSNIEFTNENTDSGIDNEICEAEHTEDSFINGKYEVSEEGVNSFRFNFGLRYDDAIEIKIYPECLMNAVRKIEKIREYTIQKVGKYQAVCLLCRCDLLGKTKISKNAIEYHLLGQRHLRLASSPKSVTALKKYHELFLNFNVNFQAHQVFFKPASSAVKCVLCNLVVNYENVSTHIRTEPHKGKVLDMFEQNSSLFHLIELQVQVYEVTPAQIENKEKENEKVSVKTKVSNEKTDSDSSPSSDTKETKHNIIKSVENSSSKNVLDLIPNRFREHLKYLKINQFQDVVTCILCKITLPKNIEIIKKHIRKASHTKASNIKQKKYNYYCEICNMKILDETSWITHFTDGPNRHANMAESRKSKTTEYECTKCFTVIYGDDLSLTRHLTVNSRKDKRVKEMKLPEPILKMFGSKAIIETEAGKLAFEANDALKYNQLTKECCNRLELTLNATFTGCKVYPFGSRISGLGDQYSDLDVFIDTGGMYAGYKNQDPLSQVQLVRKVAGILNKHKEEFQDVVQIPTARTPIVKLFHITEIECDLSFKHGLSVENTKFIRFCLDLQPITQPFVLLLKKWSQHNNFTEHICTYALALMAIFYLQVNNYLLSVKKLRKLNPRKSLVINGWETINYTMPLEEMKTFVDQYPHTISTLLKQFFAFYAKFKYTEEVICPLLGHTILKKQFHENNLPIEMRSYVAQLQSEEPEEFRVLSSMCIQDPFDLSHNLAKACQPGTINKFIAMCDLSFKQLDSLD